jgi:hypothetical protein
MKAELKQVETKELKVGDLLYSSDSFGDFGIVVKRGKTFIHKHRFCVIRWFGASIFGGFEEQDSKFMDERHIKFHKIVVSK